MKRTIKLALAATMALSATSAFATNGDNLIGLGAKSRAMGGTGIAHFNDGESATANPALIAKTKGTHFTFGGTYFRPDVEVKKTGAVAGAGALPVSDSYQSDAKHNIIPYVALTENLGDGFAIGASMFGSAGMGTDWRNEEINYMNGVIPGTAPDMGLYSMRSNLLLLKFSIPMAYGGDNWSVGIAPVLMYGSLDIAFQTPLRDNTGAMVMVGGAPYSQDIGSGSSSSFGLGLELGAQYTLPDAGLTFGATYHSSIEMEYKNQISGAASAFGYGANVMGTGFGAFKDKLEQPAEYGLGVDWSQGDISVTADWKNIRWGNARGYEDFGWNNQNVYALGAEYRMDDLALRMGYNYGKNPIEADNFSTRSVTGMPLAMGGNSHGDTMNALNHVLFPAITERHYTIGAGYQFTKNVGADIALTYATSPEVTVSAQTVGLGLLTTTNDQFAGSVNLNYSF
ncbi:OmpP1/FadL family transporter [Campylobacterota bacterium]